MSESLPARDTALLTAEVLRECRAAAAAATAQLRAGDDELAALRSAWPLKWAQLLARPGVGERAAAAQHAADVKLAALGADSTRRHADLLVEVLRGGAQPRCEA